MKPEDIEYMRDMAEAGQDAPLLGGRIGLMWGCLLTVTLIAHWLILTQTVALPPISLAVLWGAFAILGGLGTFILGRTLEGKPGSGSVGNKVEAAVWGYVGLTLFVIAAGIICMIAMGRVDVSFFDFMIVVAFGMYGMAYLIIAQVSSHKWLRGFGVGALGSVIGAAVFFNTPFLYLYAAGIVFITVVIPEMINMSREPKTVV